MSSELNEPPRPMDSLNYRKIAGHWLTGVTVVTAMSMEGPPVGLTMNAVAPLSLAPPQFLINLDLKSDTFAAIKGTQRFCINFLGAHQAELCRSFARKGAGKFDGVSHHTGCLNLPVIDGCIAHVECSVSAIHISGDHAIVIGDAFHGTAQGGEPLVYFSSAFRNLAPCA